MNELQEFIELEELHGLKDGGKANHILPDTQKEFYVWMKQPFASFIKMTFINFCTAPKLRNIKSFHCTVKCRAMVMLS